MNVSGVLHSPCVGLERVACVVVLVYVVLLTGGCGGGGPDIPDEPIGLLPDDWENIIVIDMQGVLGGDAPPNYVEAFEREGEPQFEEIGVFAEDVTTLVIAEMRDGSGLSVMKGDMDFEIVRDELFDAGMDEDEYRGWELWSGGRLEWARSVAVLDDDDYLVIGSRETGGPIDVLRGLGRESGLVAHDEDDHVDELMERAGEGWYVAMRTGEDCWGVNLRGCEAVAWSTRTGDEYDMYVTWVYAFRDERSARAALHDLQDMFDRLDALVIQDVSEDGQFVVVAGTLDEEDWTTDVWRWPAMASASAPPPASQPAPPGPPRVAPVPAPQPAPLAPAVATMPQPAPPGPPRVAPVPAPQPAPTVAPAVATMPQPAAPAVVSIPTATPTAVPAVISVPTAIPTAVPTATPVPMFSGGLGIAVKSVGRANGVPGFCGVGCSDQIHVSGLTETLFSAVSTPDGVITTEPMLATGFTLDPSLEFASIGLRRGAQFHHGWGEMTARDVAYSLNNANPTTNPDSIHEHGVSLSEVIASVEAIDDYTVRVNYHSYDPRGPLYLFSGYLDTVGIMSGDVFDQYGVEGTQDVHVGVGPFMAEDANYIDAWIENNRVSLRANPDYYGIDEGFGPFVEHIKWAQAPEVTTRTAMLETGEADIAEIDASRYAQVESIGIKLKDDGALSRTRGISWAGNYWESHDGATGAQLERERDISRPWVGNPFENGDAYDEGTTSMLRSQKVREALSWAVDREGMVEQVLNGYGSVNHQPGLSASNPNYREEWSWGTDYQRAAQLLGEAGYPEGFEVDLRVSGEFLTWELADALSGSWSEHLGVTVSIDQADYSEYRRDLEDRSANTVTISGCALGGGSNLPYDWPRGFLLSSLSTGHPGAGQELPYATESYSSMTGEPDRSARHDLAAHFYSENRRWANCSGLIEVPVWPAYNPERVAEWEIRPTAIPTMGSINNIRSVRVR